MDTVIHKPGNAMNAFCSGLGSGETTCMRGISLARCVMSFHGGPIGGGVLDLPSEGGCKPFLSLFHKQRVELEGRGCEKS